MSTDDLTKKGTKVAFTRRSGSKDTGTVVGTQTGGRGSFVLIKDSQGADYKCRASELTRAV